MSSQKQRRSFPSITACDTSETASYESIAADLDGTLLISRSSFPYFMLVAIEAGSLLQGLVFRKMRNSLMARSFGYCSLWAVASSSSEASKLFGVFSGTVAESNEKRFARAPVEMSGLLQRGV